MFSKSQDPALSAEYTAPDGRVFQSRKEWREYMVATFYSYKNRQNEPNTLLKLPGSINGQMFNIANIENCTIAICDACDTVYIDHVKKSKIFIAATSSSTVIRDCEDCIFFTCCQLLRLQDCIRCDLYLLTNSEVNVESCKALRFGPFRGGYPEHREHLEKANLNIASNRWNKIVDTTSDPQRKKFGGLVNWSFIPQQQYADPWFPLVETVVDAPANDLLEVTAADTSVESPPPPPPVSLPVEENCSNAPPETSIESATSVAMNPDDIKAEDFPVKSAESEVQEQLCEQWRCSVAKKLFFSQLGTLTLIELGTTARRPAKLAKSKKLSEVLLEDKLDRFKISGEGQNIKVSVKKESYLANNPDAAAQFEKLCEEWRDKIARYFFKNDFKYLTLTDLGSAVYRPSKLNSGAKLVKVLQDDDCGRFEIREHRVLFKAPAFLRTASDAEVIIEGLCENWRERIATFFVGHNFISLLPSEVGTAVIRPSFLPKSISLKDVILNDPLKRFTLSEDKKIIFNVQSVPRTGNSKSIAAENVDASIAIASALPESALNVTPIQSDADIAVEAISVIKQYIAEADELFEFQGKLAMEFDLLSALMSNWCERYAPHLGSLDEFCLKTPVFRVIFNPDTKSTLVRERTVDPSSAKLGGADPKDLNHGELPPMSVQIIHDGTDKSSVAPHVGKRIQDFFKLPDQEDQKEKAYLRDLERTRDLIRHLLHSPQKGKKSEYFGSFMRNGTMKFEENEWLGDAVLEALLSECIIANQNPQSIEQLEVATAARRLAAQNWTLALIYEELQLSMFLNDANCQVMALDFKMKGDAVESFIGELYTFITRDPSTLAEEWQQLIAVAYDALHKIVAHALYRSQFLLSAKDTSKLLADAIKPGGGGILHSITDIKVAFQNKPDITLDIDDSAIEVEEKLAAKSEPPSSFGPSWVDDEVQRWHIEIDRIFTSTNGTKPVNIYSIKNSDLTGFRSRYPKVGANEYASEVLKGLERSGLFVCVGKSNGDLLPQDREIYSGVRPFLDAASVDVEDAELNKAIATWASKALVEIRRYKGEVPFYISAILADDSVKTRADKLTYVSKIEAGLRRDSRFIYEYRCVKKDETEIKQGPCLWPSLPAKDNLLCDNGHFLTPQTLMVSKKSSCSRCGTSIANGSRILACCHPEYLYSCCYSCYSGLMETRLLHSLRALTADKPQALQLNGDEKSVEAQEALKQLAVDVDFWSNPHNFCLGSLQSFEGYVKKASKLLLEVDEDNENNEGLILENKTEYKSGPVTVTKVTPAEAPIKLETVKGVDNQKDVVPAADTTWIPAAVQYWIREIESKHRSSNATNPVNGYHIRLFHQSDKKFHVENPDISAAKYANEIFCGLRKTGMFVCVGKGNQDIWPQDRELYSGVRPFLDAASVDVEDAELNKAIATWASKALVEIRRYKGEVPFYISAILADDSVKTRADKLTYVSKIEAGLRRDSRFIYEYRCVKKDETKLKQGPCLWPNLPQDNFLSCDHEHILLFKTLNSSKANSCSRCGTSIANGSRILACSHHAHSYSCCLSCYTGLMEKRLLQNLRALTTDNPQALQITGPTIEDLKEASKPLAAQLNFWSDPHCLCLGNLQSFMGYVKKASELEAISTLKLLIADSAVLSDEKGKLVLELARLESIVKWSDCFGYLGSIESFVDNAKTVFRVMDIPKIGKVVREVTVVADVEPLDEESLQNKLQHYFVPKATEDVEYLKQTSALREKILSITTLEDYRDHGTDTFMLFSWFGRAYFHLKLSEYVLKTCDVKTPGQLSNVRRGAEQRYTLAMLFVSLGLPDFLTHGVQHSADVVAAIIGECKLKLIRAGDDKMIDLTDRFVRLAYVTANKLLPMYK